MFSLNLAESWEAEAAFMLSFPMSKPFSYYLKRRMVTQPAACFSNNPYNNNNQLHSATIHITLTSKSIDPSDRSQQ